MKIREIAKNLTHHFVCILQLLALLLIWSIFLPLGIERSSRTFSFLIRKIGPKLKYHRVIVENIARCFPSLNHDERNQLALKAWENLGAIVGESPFLKIISQKELQRRLIIEDSAKAFTPGAKVIVILHMANFEILASLPEQMNMMMHFLYAKQRNPYIDKMMYLFRRKPFAQPHQNRSFNGLKALTLALKRGEIIGLLGDQRAKGCMATFFSHPVQSSTLAAKFVLSHGCPLFLLKLHRTGTATYHIDTEAIPVYPDDDAIAITQRANDAMEAWIRQHPEQWYWMHNRFKLPS